MRALGQPADEIHPRQALEDELRARSRVEGYFIYGTWILVGILALNWLGSTFKVSRRRR